MSQSGPISGPKRPHAGASISPTNKPATRSWCGGSRGFREKTPMKLDRSGTQRDSRRESRRQDSSDLDSRYGKIGISAVAAALRYPADAKNTHHAPANPAASRQDEDA